MRDDEQPVWCPSIELVTWGMMLLPFAMGALAWLV